MKLSAIATILLLIISSDAVARPQYQQSMIDYFQTRMWKYNEPTNAELEEFYALYKKTYSYTDLWFKNALELRKYTEFFRFYHQGKVIAFFSGTFTAYGLKVSLIATDGSRAALLAMNDFLKTSSHLVGLYTEISAKFAEHALKTYSSSIVERSRVFDIFKNEDVRIPTSEEIHKAIESKRIPSLERVKQNAYIRRFTFEGKVFNEMYVMLGNPRDLNACVKKFTKNQKK